MQQEKRFYDYNTFLRKKFGEKVYKISLDAGFTCPNRDGTVGVGGCIYCNNASFSPAVNYGKVALDQQIQKGMSMGEKFKARKFIAYFQAYTNTYASVTQLEQIYSQVLKYPEIVGIAIGTRPDAVDIEKLEFLESLGKKIFVSIEYGVQSINNNILEWIHRGHKYEDFLKVMEYSQNRGLHICCHLMLGFPHQNKEEVLDTALEMNRLGVQGIKLHNLLVVRDTLLAKIYEEKPFPLIEFKDYLNLVCDFLERLDTNIVCERLHATAPTEYLIAPHWPLSIQMNHAVTQEFVRRGTYQGIFS